MRHFAAILVFGTSAAIISGCSSGGTSMPVAPTPTLKSGNWLIVETGVSVLSAANGGGSEVFNANLRGPLTISGGTITGNLSSNDQPPLAYSGTTSGDTVSLTSAPDFNGESYKLAGAINSNGTVLGTYSLENGYNGLTSTGTLYGTNIPAIAGSWNGTLPGGFSGASQYPASTISANLTQASSASIINDVSAFVISGTFALTNSSCTGPGSVNLIIDPTASYISGDLLVFSAASADGTESFTWSSRLDNPTLATATSNGTFALSAPNCPSISGIKTGILTTQ